MSQKHILDTLPFTPCPACRVQDSKHSMCDYCGNSRFLLRYKQSLLYWGRKIDAWHVAYYRLISELKKLFFGSLLLFSIGGKFALVLFIVESYAYYTNPFILLFNGAYDIRILFFWLSLLFDLYIFYRLTWEKEQAQSPPASRKLLVKTTDPKKNSLVDISHFFF